MDQVALRQAIDRLAAAVSDLQAIVNAPAGLAPTTALRPLIWGQKVSTTFKESVLWIENDLKLNADNLMACIAFETGAKFSPSVKNLAGSSGTGLIQFMSFTAKNLGTTVAELATMTAERQLGFVWKYFRGFGTNFSDWSLEDTYMAILFPKAIGKPNDWVMPWEYGSIAYKQNSGLDLDKDRRVTKAEASAGVRKMYQLGKQFIG